MCGDSNRPTYGGTIAVLFPRDLPPSSDTQQSLSSSPDSTTSSSSSLSTISSYSLLFRDLGPDSRKTNAVFRIDDVQTYETLRQCQHVNMRIERCGDLTRNTLSTPPLHQFPIDFSKHSSQQHDPEIMDLEFELPERLELGVSEKGIVGRQVTVTEAGGAVLGVGIVGFN